MVARTRMFPAAGYWFLVLFAVSVVAFWPVYFAILPRGPEALVHLHMLGVTGWFALLISQPFLIAHGRWPTHRRLGKLSYALAPYIVITSVLLAHSRFARMDADAFARDGHSLYLPLVATALFLLCYALAMQSRVRAPLHARYMFGTALSFADPITARLLFFYTPLPPGPILYPLIGFGLADLALVVLFVTDKDRRSGRAFALLLGIFVVAHVGWFTLAQTRPWFAFAEWFTRLPLT